MTYSVTRFVAYARMPQKLVEVRVNVTPWSITPYNSYNYHYDLDCALDYDYDPLLL